MPHTMPWTLGRTLQSVVAGFVGLAVLGTATAAKADGDFIDNLKLEVDAFGGAHIFAHDLELGVADDPTLTTPRMASMLAIGSADAWTWAM